ELGRAQRRTLGGAALGARASAVSWLPRRALRGSRHPLRGAGRAAGGALAAREGGGGPRRAGRAARGPAGARSHPLTRRALSARATTPGRSPSGRERSPSNAYQRRGLPPRSPPRPPPRPPPPNERSPPPKERSPPSRGRAMLTLSVRPSRF